MSRLESDPKEIEKIYPQVQEFLNLYPDGHLSLSNSEKFMELTFECSNPKLDVRITFIDAQELDYKISEFKKVVGKSYELKDYFYMLQPNIYEINYLFTKNYMCVNFTIHFLVGVWLGAVTRCRKMLYIGGIRFLDWDKSKVFFSLLKGTWKNRKKKLVLIEQVKEEISSLYYDVTDYGILRKIRNFARANKDIIRDLLKIKIFEGA